MWEERSCRQTREWQHWGSGCYKYKCENRHLSIIVANYTYVCYYPGQQIYIRIMSGGWLHKGAVICPPCHELCGDYFAEQGEECRIQEEAPPSNKYPHDNLSCGGAAGTARYTNENLLAQQKLLIASVLGYILLNQILLR